MGDNLSENRFCVKIIAKFHWKLHSNKSRKYLQGFWSFCWYFSKIQLKYIVHTTNSFKAFIYRSHSGEQCRHFYTPSLKCGEVLCYTLRCLSVRPSVRPSVRRSVRPCSPFPIDNLSIYSRNFFKFCIHIVIGDEWYGIVNGQNPSIFNGVTALFRIGKMVSGLLFLYCLWYLNETSQICCTSKVTYCD